MAPPGERPAAQSWSAAAGEPEAWQESKEPSPWSAPAQPAGDWDTAAHPPGADQWAAPAEAPANQEEWSAPQTSAAPRPLAGRSSAIPDESAWSAPPPAEGADLSPEPAAPGWTRQQRPEFAALPMGASLAGEEEDAGPHALGEDEAASLLRPVEDDAASILRPVEEAANDAPAGPRRVVDERRRLRAVEDTPADGPPSLLHPPGDLDPALQPVMDPTLQPVADGEAVRLLHPHDHPDLLVPVDEHAPPMASGSAGRAATIVAGEHRVAIHTRAGRTRRGSVTDLDLARPQFALQPQGGGSTEILPHADVKAIFFMLAPGEPPVTPDGPKVRVTFSDGRSVEGHRDGGDGPQGFFLVPVDAQKTNTRRIYVALAAVAHLTDL